jgi:hypothetical protein
MPTPELLDQVRTVARLKHLSLKTEQAYGDLVRVAFVSLRGSFAWLSSEERSTKSHERTRRMTNGNYFAFSAHGLAPIGTSAVT